jgi:hypothetical protein
VLFVPIHVAAIKCGTTQVHEVAKFIQDILFASWTKRLVAFAARRCDSIAAKIWGINQFALFRPGAAKFFKVFLPFFIGRNETILTLLAVGGRVFI